LLPLEETPDGGRLMKSNAAPQSSMNLDGDPFLERNIFLV